MTTLEKLAALVRDTSSSLPADVLRGLAAAKRRETRGSCADEVLGTILENCAVASSRRVPLCQDTGTLSFFIDRALERIASPAIVRRAVAAATERGWLRRNCIDPVDGSSFDDNCAPGAPFIEYVSPEDFPSVPRGGAVLLMKGGGSENMSRQYSLPDSSLGAGRDMRGAAACAVDAAKKALGYGCAPGILGICIGGDRATGFKVAKEQLLRPLRGDGAPDKTVRDRALRRLERDVLAAANATGIGPMGLGGRTTLLGVKAAAAPRVPASFFVTVAYMCWACRRRSAILK